MKEGIKSGIVITDIRNFTGTFGEFQKMGSGDFKNFFVQEFYDIHIKIAESISDEFWFNSLGDSMIFVFFGKNYYKDAYTFSMVLHKILKTKCLNFNTKYDTKISFGIGVETGKVWKMEIKNSFGSHITFLGNTINSVKRIETQTKSFGETEMLVGGNLYDDIMADLFATEYEEANIFESNYIEILRNKPSLVLMSEKILLYYIFKLNLPGITEPLPLFRYDNDLSANDKDFWYVVSKLVSEEIQEKLLKIVE